MLADEDLAVRREVNGHWVLEPVQRIVSFFAGARYFEGIRLEPRRERLRARTARHREGDGKGRQKEAQGPRAICFTETGQGGKYRIATAGLQQCKTWVHGWETVSGVLRCAVPKALGQLACSVVRAHICTRGARRRH